MKKCAINTNGSRNNALQQISGYDTKGQSEWLKMLLRTDMSNVITEAELEEHAVLNHLKDYFAERGEMNC